MDQIAILIPCFNEYKTIKKVVMDWQTAMPQAAIYVYDNNSTDGTANIAKEAGRLFGMNEIGAKAMLFFYWSDFVFCD